jgi:hypothetical protein
MKDWAPSGLFHTITSDMNEVVNLGKRLYPDPGNLFNYAPAKIKETGHYPKLTVPRHHYEWLKSGLLELLNVSSDKIVRPVVCFHILLDAPYQRSRNHVFAEWEKCIRELAGSGVTCFRVGHPATAKKSIEGENIYDLTKHGLTPSQSIAVISMCDVYVGGDTGMTHAASALGKKVVGIWGDCTHMLRDKSVPNNFQDGDWDTTPYVPEENRYMLRRHGGEHSIEPVYSSDQILEGIGHFLNRG